MRGQLRVTSGSGVRWDGHVHTWVPSGVTCWLTGERPACSSRTSPALTCGSEVRGQGSAYPGGRGRYLLPQSAAVLQGGQQGVLTSSLSLAGGVKVLEHRQEVTGGRDSCSLEAGPGRARSPCPAGRRRSCGEPPPLQGSREESRSVQTAAGGGGATCHGVLQRDVAEQLPLGHGPQGCSCGAAGAAGVTGVLRGAAGRRCWELRRRRPGDGSSVLGCGHTSLRFSSHLGRSQRRSSRGAELHAGVRGHRRT